MRTLRALSFTATAAALAGCASTTHDLRREPIVKPGLIALTPEQAAQRGLSTERYADGRDARPALVAGLDASAVVLPPDIEVYPIGRTVDAANPEIMHEEHVVYRRTAPRWRLDAPSGQKILVGPRLTDGRGELQPLLSKELAAYLSDQRKATTENQKAITALSQALETVTRQQQELAKRQANAAAASKGEAAAPQNPGIESAPQERSE